MNIYPLNETSIPVVAAFMARIKPQFWDFDGALHQLGTGVGWYMGESPEEPAGWVFCKDLQPYRTLEIECLGYEENNECIIGEPLQPLIETCEKWAQEQNYANMRFTIGSRGLSCHLQPLLLNPWEEIRSITAIDRPEYDWFLSMGYVPSGILPDIYGEKYHGILLVKKI